MVATVQVTCIISNQEGNPSAGATITALLSGADVDQVSGGYVLPELITGTTNSSGICVLALWPNQLGSLGTQYVVTITDPVTSRTTTINATIPNANCRLDLVANLPTYPVVAQAQLAINAAIAQVAPAINAANEATTAAATATSSAILATTQAGNASASASAAATSAAAAAASAAAAAASGGTGSVTASSIGLGNVNNTSDANKPVSTAQAAANAAVLASAESFTTSQIAALTPAAIGLGNVNNTSDVNKPVSTAQAAANAVVLASAESFTTSQIAALTPASVGLSNVNNTSDVNKPVSTAQAAAIASATSTAKVWRGLGQAMTEVVQYWNVTAGISQTVRSRHYSNTRFRQNRAVIPTFWLPSIGGAVQEVPYPCGLNFQVAFEASFTNAVTGLGPRQLFTFSGSNVAMYAVITGATINQNSNSISCTNILGNFGNGQPVFYGTTIVGYIQTSSGTTSITLLQNYTGQNLSNVTLTTNNGATQQAGCIVSDILDPGAYYVPGTTSAPNFFGLHTTVENPTQVIINGATFSTSANTFTCTSVVGPGFGQGSPVFYNNAQIGTIATVVTAGSSYTLTANASATASSVTAYAQALPAMKPMSNWLQRYLGVINTVTAAAGTGTATASTSVAITGGTNWVKGQLFQSATGTVPAGTYVVDTTGASGSVTLTLNNAVTVTGACTGILSYIHADQARSGASYGSASASPGGQTTYFTPCMLQILTNSTNPNITCLGDSIEFGSLEGGGMASFTGYIASGVINVVSGLGGVVMATGETMWSNGSTPLGTIGTNIAGGSTNGSTWNTTAANIGSSGSPVLIYFSPSSNYGDAFGSALGNSGWFERGANELLGYNVVNLSKGGDANAYWLNSAYSQFRQQLLALSNPTHVMAGMVHNDIAHYCNTNTTVWAAGATHSIGDVVSGSGATSDYVAVGVSVPNATSGTTGVTNLTGTTYGANIVDGTMIWQYIGPHSATGNREGANLVLAAIYMVNRIIKSLCPGANIVQKMPTIDAASTDQYQTTANQTPTLGGWGGGSASTRMQIYTALQNSSIQSLLQINALIDPSVYLESGGSGTSGDWVVNGTPFYATTEGTHPHSGGNYLAQPAVTAACFPSVY